MDPITQQTVLAAAGAGGDKVYVDDVFSTTLYKGTEGTEQTIISGIDNTEKSMLWIKDRDQSYPHYIYDTVRGNNKFLVPSSTTGEGTDNSGPGGSAVMMTGFTNNGFKVNDAQVNATPDSIAAWNFKAAPGFFDVVTWSGNSTAGRQIAHNLGSVPGMIIVKSTSQARQWSCFHRELGNTKFLILNSTDSQLTSAHYWNNTSPTSSVFTLGADADVNQSGTNYVAYIFAHDDASFGTDSDESIIKCGSYTGNQVAAGPVINLGFEPQWLMVKAATGTGPWIIQDMMRSGDINNASDNSLSPNSNGAETGSYPNLGVTATGFQPKSGSSYINGNGDTYIYMAIRRPNKPPELATDVFAMDTYGGTSPTPPTYYSGFPVDLVLNRETNSSSDMRGSARLTGLTRLRLSQNYAELSDTSAKFDQQNGFKDAAGTLTAWQAWMFKRAPGFMDVVAYTANNNTAFNVNHNLGVAPELILIKDRDSARNWLVGSDALTAWGNYGLKLNTDDSENTASNYFTAAPTSTQFKLGTASDVNLGTDKFIAYLFATLPGISKVGSYTGNGGSSSFNVDCGFTNGARFVLIKDTTSGNDWYLWDTLRGMTSSAAPYLRLNITGQQSASDWVETQPTGFKVTTGTNANLRINVSGNAYLFLAIA